MFKRDVIRQQHFIVSGSFVFVDEAFFNLGRGESCVVLKNAVPATMVTISKHAVNSAPDVKPTLSVVASRTVFVVDVHLFIDV